MTRATTTTTPTGLARAPRRKPRGAEAQTGPRHDILVASRWRNSWEAGCQQLTAETGVNNSIMQLEAEQRDVFTRSGAQDSGTAVAVIDGARGRRKPTHALTDTMQNWENDKRISLTYSQTLCYSRTWRTKVVCSSLMHTQTFTQTRRCRRTCKSACHRVRRLAYYSQQKITCAHYCGHIVVLISIKLNLQLYKLYISCCSWSLSLLLIENSTSAS